MIDTHIHSDTRPYEDFERMALSLEGVITLAHDPLKPYSMDILRAHFDRLIEGEVERAKKNGLKLFLCLGIHPRMIPPDVNYSMLREYLKNEHVVGVGEIGLEKGNKEEIEVFERQLLIAQELNLGAVVHTPRRRKEEVTKTILEVIDSLDLKREMERRIVIDHCNRRIVPQIYDREMYMGLTVQPNKLTPEEAVEIVKEYGGDRFLLNSDSSSAPSDILAVPRTVLRMKIEGIEEEVIERVSHINARELFNLNI
ncbi:MAG TPA: hypothetical protein EYH15_03805 [Methanothermococcus okinawensis]|uniref:Uncharacterized protein n=1 Tax=Methanothermococcus okinawensis TaxID=155863 RepID=A0A832ZJT3_9EURY|nr:hypothetical protein [Methanococcaceae archaeon]HIP84592.1 hypothetical protein [Methanothermococcus okinawensis]HIP91456.1 hypothetical protein [Methanothermococcus okinawensis]